MDTASFAHPALKVARYIGKNYVLPLEKKGFEALEKFGNNDKMEVLDSQPLTAAEKQWAATMKRKM